MVPHTPVIPAIAASENDACIYDKGPAWSHGRRIETMQTFEHWSVVAHFLAGNRVELRAVDGTPPHDPEDGGMRSTSA